MRLRLSTTLLLSAALGCDQQTQAGEQPALISVLPNQLPVGMATPIAIEGTGLYVKMVNDLIEPGPLRTRDRFSGDIGGHPLEQLRWESNTQLHAMSPADLPLGVYDLQIVTPDKRTLNLENAVAVVESIGSWATCPWWSSLHGFRSPLTISNRSANPVALGYTVTLTFDHAALVSAGKSRAGGNDLRVVFCNGAGANTEIDRVDASVFATPNGSASWGTASAQISFATVRSVPAGWDDSGYALYYGNPADGAASNDPSAVYDFWEPFDDLSRWTVVNTPGEYIS
ncbi:MAG: hypothetical protein V3T05_10080 [Myxococcota bacterium]